MKKQWQFNGGFASANNNKFEDYSGDVAYYIKSSKLSVKNRVRYFTCRNATFQVNKDGFIKWYDGEWLDGDFYGQFFGGIFWNCNKIKFEE